MTRDELIAALERATGPDRELDYAIIDLNIAEAMAAGHAITADAFPPPRYTASIDAALSLVPDGEPWLLFRYENGQMFAECGGDDPQQYTGATPAIALCIASLKARQCQ